MVKLWFLNCGDTIAKIRVRRKEFVTRNIIGNRVFGGNSIALISLKISRWSRDSSNLLGTRVVGIGLAGRE